MQNYPIGIELSLNKAVSKYLIKFLFYLRRTSPLKENNTKLEAMLIAKLFLFHLMHTMTNLPTKQNWPG